VRRFLLALVFFGAAILLLRRLAGLFVSTGKPPGSGRARRHNGATELVRDRVCNTFLPKNKALELTADGEIHFFCSKECRSRFLAGPIPSANIARRA